jgi:hypothetical protein
MKNQSIQPLKNKNKPTAPKAEKQKMSASKKNGICYECQKNTDFIRKKNLP